MVGAFYTENGSWGVMALEMARLSHDRWRLRGLFSHMDVRYRFYGIGDSAGNAGRSVGIQQQMNFAALSALGRVMPGLYVGATALFVQSTIALRDSVAGLPPPSTDLAETGLFAPGLVVEVDTRNDDYWPTTGVLAKLKSSFFISGLGGERDFQRYTAFWSWYWPLRAERLVLIGNVNACAAQGDSPYYTLCSIGAGLGGLRGYTQGRYRDTVMTTMQAELRYHTAGRLGAVAFAGFGQVAPALGDIFEADILPAGGVGLRYRLTRNFPMHMRVDYAWGRNGSLLYFGVAEAF
jgi:outer membrane protein assembly factor BamA